MPIGAYALVTLFLACSVVAGIVAVRLVARVGGPSTRWAYPLPILGAFLAFYVIGHRLGVVLGPEIGLFGFQVALLGDIAIGFAAALAVAGIQAVVQPARPDRSARQPS